MWTDYVASWKGVRTGWFGSSRQNANIHCDALRHKTNSWETQTDMPSLQKTGTLPKPVPLAQERERPKWHQQNSAGSNNDSNYNTGQSNSNTHNNKTVMNGNANSLNNRIDRKPRTLCAACETCDRTNHSIEKFYFGANAANRPPPRNRKPMEQSQNQQQDTQINTVERVQAAV